jgi:hypothetical protein
MGYLQVAFYVLIIFILIFALVTDLRQYNCDNYVCTTYEHSQERGETSAKRSLSVLNDLSYPIIWKRAFITALMCSIVINLCMFGELTMINVFYVILIIYVAVYFVLSWNGTHTVEPLLRKVGDHIKKYDQLHRRYKKVVKKLRANHYLKS